MTKDELRNLLIDFADHLNTYKGFEEVRFDFMVVDYLDKTKQAGINTSIVRGGDSESQLVERTKRYFKYPDWIERRITPTEPLPAE